MRGPLLRREIVKICYESIAKANMAINGLRTSLDLSIGAKPLARSPGPKPEKARSIGKALLALRMKDLRYGDISMDSRFFVDPMRDLIEVELFDLSSFSSIGRGRMNEAFLQAVKDHDPDLVFSAIAKDELDKRTIDAVTFGTRSITCNWFTDDHWRLDTFGRFYAPHFDYCVSVDPLSCSRYKALGYDNVLLSQWAANPHIHHKPERAVRDRGVSFIGQDYAGRRALLARRKAEGVDLLCYGEGWPSGYISFPEMDALYHRSKVNLNFSASALGPTKQIKSRVFDIPASGGFLLTEDAPGLSECFEIGKEIAVFDGIDDAVEKIVYYLDADSEREEMAERGYQRVMRDHLYQHRLEGLFRDILGPSRS